MSDHTVKRIDEMEAIAFGAFKRARAELGVSAFGFQVLDLPPNNELYPEHDHAESGQEEVFITMRGEGEIEIEGERHRLDPETMVRVGPETRRKVWPGDEGMRLLVIGGTPGEPYTPSEASQLGAPDRFTEQVRAAQSG